MARYARPVGFRIDSYIEICVAIYAQQSESFIYEITQMIGQGYGRNRVTVGDRMALRAGGV